MRQLAVVLGIGVLFGGVARLDAADKAAIEKAMKASEGTWQIVSRVKDGEKTPAEKLKRFRLVIKGKTWTVYRDGELYLTGTRKIVSIGQGFRKAVISTSTGKTWNNIAKLEGDKLTTCRAPEGKPHPTKFTSKEGHTLTVYKRVKK